MIDIPLPQNKGKAMNSKQKQKKKEKLVEYYGSFCYWCGSYFPVKELTLDHLNPKSLGGSNSFENLRLACRDCNQTRGNSPYPPGIQPVLA